MVMTAEKPTYYTPEEIAQELRVSLRTVYRLVERGQLDAVRVGDLYRIPRESLDAFLRRKGSSSP